MTEKAKRGKEETDDRGRGGGGQAATGENRLRHPAVHDGVEPAVVRAGPSRVRSVPPRPGFDESPLHLRRSVIILYYIILYYIISYFYCYYYCYFRPGFDEGMLHLRKKITIIIIIMINMIIVIVVVVVIIIIIIIITIVLIQDSTKARSTFVDGNFYLFIDVLL